MEILGVGPLELIFLFIIVLVVLGPEEMIATGKKLGEYWGKFLRSDAWKAIRSISDEARTLPNRLARDAGLDDIGNTISAPLVPPKDAQSDEDVNISSWVTSPKEPSSTNENDN